MRLLTIFLFFGIIIFGCNNENNNRSKNNIEISKNKKSDSIIISKIDSSQIPKKISFIGKFKQGFKWSDSNGQNIIFLTETGFFRDKNLTHEFDNSLDSELHAYSYNIKNDTYKINWKINDFVRDCPVDIVANFIDNSLQITDLNKNGIAEVWTIYKIVCHGDVSPSEMKIIMYEGSQKYAMRGENKVQVGINDNNEPQYIGGEYKMDKQFANDPKIFKEFAKKLWDENIIETWK
ncbi:M949_RS01915 family surface polysaccharide biosynthesis protein [Chishuiella sp.]|uniref:M949_RS01915 family surface polysaccharide biosynthesis protein n=1 Tax=Chishuiella sp. TaxID=1969467 RepID=UPI0028A73D7D|nr:hypothetical protein [Chishuiella sp.]